MTSTSTVASSLFTSPLTAGTSSILYFITLLRQQKRYNFHIIFKLIRESKGMSNCLVHTYKDVEACSSVTES
jgi:hypothetical protein